MRIFIGVDGGGTHSTLAAADENGRLLASCGGGALNYNSIGLPAARENLRSAVAELLALAGADGYEKLAAGLSALDGEASPAELHAFAGNCFSAGSLVLSSDAHMSLLGAALGRPGVLLISGTGSMGAALGTDGSFYTGGGWGWLTDDDGSAFYIGKRALKAAAECEEYGGETLLLPLLLEHFGVSSLRGAIPALYSGGVSGTASLAPVADEAAERGDSTARKIISDGALALARLGARLITLSGAADIYLCGGVFAHSRLFLSEFRRLLTELRADAVVKAPALPAEFGALIAAARAAGADTPTFISGLIASAREIAR